MKQTILILIASFFVFLENSHAQESLEDIYLKGGEYTEVNKAIKEAENHFGRDINLPVRIPSTAYTHSFGVFRKEGISQLTVKYLNENTGYTHYTLSITAKIDGPNVKSPQEIVSLKNGQKALYLNRDNIDALLFEKNSFEYILSLDKKSFGRNSKETLVQIANSIR